MVARPVQADIAPPPPGFGSNPFTDSSGTQVQMVSEVVTFDVTNSNLDDRGFARVSAIFNMHNHGDQAETMVARFPLCGYEIDQCVWSPAPSINDLAVWVDGSSVPVTTTTANVFAQDGSNKNIDIPAWGNFKVTFPAGKDVIIQVTYTAWGYGRDSQAGYVEYDYILQTGALWNGPIQQADFIFRLPYDVNDQNMPDASSYSTIVGHVVRWRMENFKPDSNLEFTILKPALWLAIQAESQATKNHPNDGEAWGRLALAYKRAGMTRHGPPAESEWVKLSLQAYQNAIRLLPKDADWHYGYADLLCGLAIMDPDQDTRLTAADPNLIGCIQQLKDALDINPNHTLALSLLKVFGMPDPGYDVNNEWLNLGVPGIVDISRAKPDYLILTPHPSATPTLIPSVTETPTITQTPAFPLPTLHFPPLADTPTLTLTVTLPPTSASPTTPAASPVQAGAESPSPLPQAKGPAQPLAPALAGLVILAGIAAFFWLRKGQPKP